MAIKGGGAAFAWVHAYGSNGSIIDDFNVSSVSRNSAGVYTINFSSNSPSANYAVVGSGEWGSGGSYRRVVTCGCGENSTKQTNRVQIFNTNPSNTQQFDPSKFHCIIFETA
jgi:hypothetical protein